MKVVDIKFLAFWNTTAYSLVDGCEIVGRQDPEGLRTEGCLWFYKIRGMLDEPSSFLRRISRVHCQILTADGREVWRIANDPFFFYLFEIFTVCFKEAISKLFERLHFKV